MTDITQTSRRNTLSTINRVLLITLSVISICTVAGYANAAPDPALIETRQGTVAGVVDGGLAVFKGIPYAAPPVGALRWKPTQPPAKHKGKLDATKFGPPCPVFDGSKMGQGKWLTAYDIFIGIPQAPGSTEDCLHLNIWAPMGVKGAAVMVWIQAGGLPSSFPLFDGAALARQGVVMVTMNFRQFTLGNFSHPALTRAAQPGEPLCCFSSMDQLAALRWVKENIAAFGGDPRNVTVFGQSAGGTATMALLTTPAARGLIDKAIIQSGSSWGSTLTLAEMETLGSWAASKAGLPGKDATADQLRALPPGALPWFGFGNIDGRFRPEDTTTAIVQGHVIDVPLLIGWTDYDGSSLRSMKPETFVEQAPGTLKAAYASDGKTGADLGYQMYTDQHVGAPARWVASKASDGAPAYLYLFSYVRSGNRGKVRGAAHGDDIVFVFDAWRNLPQVQPSEEDRAMTRRMQSCWVSFARTGKPQCEGAPDWPRYTRASDQLMDLDVEPRVLTGYRKTQLDAREAAMQDVIDESRRNLADLIHRVEAGELDPAGSASAQ